MSNVIELLERLGRDSRRRYSVGRELDQELEQAQVSAAVRAALVSGDSRRLEAHLGAYGNVCCMIAPPKGDEDEDEKTRKGKENEKEKAA